MEILIQNQSRKKLVPSAELQKLSENSLKRMMEEFNLENAEVSVLFVDDERIRELNKQYRNIDRPTDVLSFPMKDKGELEKGMTKSEMENPLGDIVISLETAVRQAREAGHGIKKEIALLLVHGFLHLLHYEDEEPAARHHMFTEQELWVARLERAGMFS